MQNRTDNLKQFSNLVVEEFRDFENRFNVVTEQAKSRFEKRRWIAQRQAVQQRIELHDQLHKKIADRARQLGITTLAKDEAQFVMDWIQKSSKEQTGFYWLLALVEEVVRQLCGEADSPVMAFDQPAEIVVMEGNSIRQGLDFVLRNINLDISLEDYDQNLQSLQQMMSQKLDAEAKVNIHFYPELFYRNQHAYLLMMVEQVKHRQSFIIPFIHTSAGLIADAVLHEQQDLMQVFSFSRSYFQVKSSAPEKLVGFILKLIPAKPMAQLLINLGYQDFGKKFLLDSLLQTLHQTQEKLDHAPGVRGMVMIVFTSPSCPLVLKIIRDTPRPPKESTKAEVIEKYNLVASLDRAGRVADAQRFYKINVSKHFFEASLLTELLESARESCQLKGDQVELCDVYIERKMTPLNIFLEERPNLAEFVIKDYGRAIHEMALSNLFPGDMLIKNFGVSGERRVIFYDYDEVTLVTECDYLQLPARWEEEDGTERSAVVLPNHIFPQELLRFLMPDRYKKYLEKDFNFLFLPEFWNELKQRLNENMVFDQAPYRPNLILKK